MKNPLIALVVLLLLVGGAFLFLGGSDDEEDSDEVASSSQADDDTDSESAETETPSADSYTIAQVAEHASESDCWTVVGDGVYDITEYVPRHPGGLEEILLACGVDGTSLFEQRTTAEGETVGSGNPHSSGAASQLDALRIGDLSQ